MSERAPYSRIYWSVRDDPKFVGVFEDDAAFALWVRLLMNADAVWPAAADLPRYARTKPLSKLIEAGIVDLVGAHGYRVHGLDAEREKRKALATTRVPDGDRTVTRRVPDGDLAEIRDEKRRERVETPREDPVDPADIYWNLTGKYPAGRALDWIDNITSSYGGDQTVRALVKAHTADKSVSNLLSRTQDLLRADARKLDLADREAEQKRLAEKRAQPRVEEPWRAEFREAIRKQYEDAS